jgi:ketosteroid isomerase-like protein
MFFLHVLPNTALYPDVFIILTFLQIASEDFFAVQSSGNSLSLADLTAVSSPTQLWEVEKIRVCSSGLTAWAIFWVAKDSTLSALTKTSAIFEKNGENWKIVHAHSSEWTTLEAAKLSVAGGKH